MSNFLLRNAEMKQTLLYRRKILVSAGAILFLGFSFTFFITSLTSKERVPVVVATESEIVDDTERGLGGGVLYPQDITLETDSGFPIELISYTTETGVTKNGEIEVEVTSGILEPAEYSQYQIVGYTSYKVASGDVVSRLAVKFGLSQGTIISVNGITNSRQLQINQVLRIPNQDGILYTVKKGDTLSAIASKHSVDAKAIKIANELLSDNIRLDAKLFLPGAKLDQMDLSEINGDLFQWPVRGRITSNYGYRPNPFGSGPREFHSGMDIAVAHGTPVKAAMSGRVSSAGYDNVYGNFVVITHHSNYKTMYGHMSAIKVKVGANVATGQQIGNVGSTGRSTGPHVHFTVYKNGVTINPRPLITR
jgi:murein DD-endopeptidase MepM/ murein hydrolase activator NlpD